MTQKTKKKATRGTDEVFLNLMKVSGNSLLKLLGMAADKAKQYHFQAVVLKEKSLKPDIEGFPTLASEEGRVFIEFQGYPDPFIRHRLMAEVFLGCTSEEYKGFVMAGIVYTDKPYQDVAEPLNAFQCLQEGEQCQLKGCFREIVLSEYTEEELERIDPKLVVLAPFTLSPQTDKTTLLVKGHEWQKKVTQKFPTEKRWEALNILGLFILNRFRQISYEEVIAMLNFDLMDTVAGKQLFEMGQVKAIREMLLEVLKARFGLVPNEMLDKIRAISQLDNLKHILIQATLSPDIDSFKGKLS